ncbi:chromatin modification-related protein eaf-1 [Drosophila hydei]|uniref:Chromatin modification-related protein eaf-1 n=1 Tax=Drosophila hydei TaxID=7224 RepID=A0A6J1LHL5_DROHY|nr:chromatin modification-related protein eaf-1 [Drosophila hydei]
MRLLLLSFLALGAHAHTIGYRNNLLAYAPARGEFPVHSELAQGYARYLDSTGAERLIAFTYPEPLYGIRTTVQSENSLLRSSSSNKVEMQQQQQHLALFRAWCEQRYNALRMELERMRAEGKQPTANILSQYEPLEQMIKMNAFEAVPGLTPELQRVRDEQLRIWNEARLKVINAEAALPQQPQLKQTFFAAQPQPQPQAVPNAKIEQPLLKQNIFTAQPQNNVPLESPKPVQETEEVKRAREEHLRRYNEALQQQPQSQAQPQPQATQQQIQEQLVKTIPIQPAEQQQAPQSVEDTPEVQRAREEHLKLYNEAILRQAAETQAQPQAQPQQQSYAPLPTIAPQAGLKSYNPSNTGAYVPAQTPKAQALQIDTLNQAKLKAEDKVADISDKIRYEEREQAAQLELQKERREEIRLLELERQREEKRLLEERRMLEAERIALEQQELERMNTERLEESQRQQAEQQELLQLQLKAAAAEGSYNLLAKPQAAQPITAAQPAQPQTIAQQQQVQNGFFLRIQSGQPSQISSPNQPSSEAYILAEHNPFLVRYAQQPQAQQLVQTISSAPAALVKTAGSAAFKSSTGLSEWEQATRDHFKAHEIALEQLRLANLKDANQIPCTH